MAISYCKYSIIIFLYSSGCVTQQGMAYYNKTQKAWEAENSQYASVKGREFVIINKYFATDWKHKPIVKNGLLSSGKDLNISRYIGMKGKLHDKTMKINHIDFWVATLENGEEIYRYYHLSSTPEDLESGNMYYVDTLNKAKSMIGKSIWINSNGVYNGKINLYNHDGTLSYPVQHLEEVTIIDVETRYTGHILGSGTLCLIVKKANGQSGLLKYNDRYFYRENPISPTWSEKITRKVKQRKVVIDMTKEQVVISWGKPQDINRTVGSWGVHEQWVYTGGKYLYFENGILTSFQD